MTAEPGASAGIDIQPLTPARWPDLEALFGPRGACAGCWCMYWVLPAAAFRAQAGAGTHAALAGRVARGEVPGLLGYVDGEPAAWCAVEPRAQYERLDRSRVLAPVDDAPVWAVPCFFVGRRASRRGLSLALLRGAVAHAGAQGAQIVEGYPVEPRGESTPPVFAWTGFVSTFRQAGFVEVARRSPRRPIMRYTLAP